MLKAKYDSEAEIPAAVKEHYAERDGAWHLALDTADNGNADVEKLQRALDSERRGRADAVKKAAQEREALEQELATLRAKVKPDDGAANPALEQMRTQIKALQDALKTADEKAATAERESAEGRFFDEVRREAAPFVLDSPGVLDDFIERRVRTHIKRDENGEFIFVNGKDPRYSLKNPGQLMPAKEFIAEVAIKAPEAAYQLRPSRGAGVTGNNGTRTGASPFAVQRGAPHEEYMRVKQAAEKAGQQVSIISD